MPTGNRLAPSVVDFVCSLLLLLLLLLASAHLDRTGACLVRVVRADGRWTENMGISSRCEWEVRTFGWSRSSVSCGERFEQTATWLGGSSEITREKLHGLSINRP